MIVESSFTNFEVVISPLGMATAKARELYTASSLFDPIMLFTL